MTWENVLKRSPVNFGALKEALLDWADIQPRGTVADVYDIMPKIKDGYRQRIEKEMRPHVVTVHIRTKFKPQVIGTLIGRIMRNNGWFYNTKNKWVKQ